MTTDVPPERNKVFISYSRMDRVWVERVRLHLRPLERDPSLGIVIWDDSEIEAGADWMAEIKSVIASTRAVVLLVSAAFLASDFIESNELPPLLDAARKEGVRILPLHVKASRFVKTAGISHFQSVNDPAAPLNGLPEAKQEEILVKLADAVERAFSQPPPARRETTPPPQADAPRAEPTASATTPPHNAQALKKLPRVKSALDELKQTLRDKLDNDDSLFEPAALIAESVLLDGLRAIARRAHPKQFARALAQSLVVAREHIRRGRQPLTEARLPHLCRYAGGDDETYRMIERVVSKYGLSEAAFAEMGRLAEGRGGQESVVKYDHTNYAPPFVRGGAVEMSVLNDVYVFITGDILLSSQVLRTIRLSLRRPLLIIAAGIEGEALEYILAHDNIAALPPIGFDHRDNEIFEDMAILTGGVVLGAGGVSFDKASERHLGRVDIVTLTNGAAYLTRPKGTPFSVELRLGKIKKDISQTDSDDDKQKLQERLKLLSSGEPIGGIEGRTEEERRQKAQRFAHMVRHCEAAFYSGVVAGEHLALANAAAAVRARVAPEEEKRADVILSDALEAPLRRMAEGFARDGDDTLRAVRAKQLESGNNDLGYYGEEDSFVDLFEAGAIIPAENVVTLMREGVEVTTQRLASFRFTDEVVRDVAAHEQALDAQKSNQPPDSEHNKRDRAIAHLRSLRGRLPEGDIGATYVLMYHQTLMEIQQDTGRNMSRFRIPPNELKPRMGKVELSEEHFCEKGKLLIFIDRAINSLKDDRQEPELDNIQLPPEPIEVKAETPEPRPAQPQTTTTHKSAEGYAPDETAVEILKQIHKGNGYEVEIAVALDLNPAHVAIRLAQLSEHDYIRLDPRDTRASRYILAPKGDEFLKKPQRLIPFPGKQIPRVFLFFNAYHPDDVENAILLFMYEEDTPRHLEQIANKFRLNIHEARLKMNRLKDGGYVYQTFDPFERREQYRLRDEGVEYVLWLKPASE